MSELDERLSQSAGGYAKRALEAYLEDEVADFVIFAGFSIEHALKAKLARENILFLAQHRRDPDFRMRVALHRSEGHLDALPPGLQTIGASDAIKIFCLLDPDNRDVVSDAQELADYRNAQAHIAHIGDAAKQRLLIKFLRAIEALLLIEPSEFWAPHGELVKGWLDEKADQTVQAINERIASSAAGFNKWIDAMDEGLAKVTIEQIENLVQGDVDGATVQAIGCPGCGLQARVDGYTEQSDWDVDYDDDGPISAYPILSFFAESFHCLACRLRLSGGDELRAADLPLSWINNEVDVDAWIAEHWSDESESW